MNLIYFGVEQMWWNVDARIGLNSQDIPAVLPIEAARLINDLVIQKQELFGTSAGDFQIVTPDDHNPLPTVGIRLSGEVLQAGLDL